MLEILLYSEIHVLCIVILIIIVFDIKKSEFNHGMRPLLLSKYIGFMSAFNLLDIFSKVPHSESLYLPPAVTYVLAALYFLCFAISAYYWFTYSEIIHDRQYLQNKKWRLISAIPIFVLFILFVVSYYNGCVFSIDAERVYHRGKFWFATAVISFGYISASAVRCSYYAPKAIGAAKKKDLINFVYYSIFSLICGAVQFLFGPFSALVTGNTILVLIIYLNYTGKLISNDPLTAIPNRRKLLHYLTEETKSLKYSETLWFMFVDIDSFKQINDKYGHSEGDRILKEITIAMKEFCKENDCFCARFGGDEFALVQKLKEYQTFAVPENLQDFIDKKNILINSENKLTASFGYTKFRRDDYSVNDMIKRADKEMYNAKMLKKSGSKNGQEERHD